MTDHLNSKRPYPIPADEAARLATLASYRILDTPADPRFDGLTALAAELFNVPIALVSLVDKDRQWFKSRHGLDALETERCVAFCAHAIMDDKAFVVEDAYLDPRFADNPLVTGAPHVRFYAGIPLAAPSGYRFGTLCLIDHKPRKLDDSQIKVLERLGRLAADEIELHRQENDARRHATARARSEEMQTVLLHSINHEFRTPLNAIMGFAELLNHDMAGPLNAEQKQYLQAIHHGGSSILRLLTGVMDMAEIDQRDIIANPAVVDAHAMIRETLQQYRQLANKHGIVMAARVCDNPSQLQADRGRLAQVLGNLISNAILYNKPEGSVEIGCTCEEGKAVTIYVADTGHGIPAARQGEVFQMFNRLGRESSNIPGTGLGLALSQRIVTAMGGLIGFESVEGQGSRFWARFQAA